MASVQGIRLAAENKHIIARPASALTAELRDAIRRHSAELLKVLTHDDRPASVDPDIKPSRDAVKRGRPLSDIPRDTRQDDRRIAASDTDAQGSTHASVETIEPAGPCPACGSGQWWQLPGEPWHCRHCQSAMPATATTLTLPCHQPPQPQLERSHAHLDPLLECACAGLMITPEQLRQELKDTDLQALASGELTLQALCRTARTLALAHHGLPDRRAEKQRARY